MINFLLLCLSLMTGCEAKSEVKGCTDGWFEFTCKYPGTSTIHSIDLVSPKGTLIKSTKKNVWEDSGDGLVSLYHDTKKKALRVAINQFLPLEFWGYQCNFYQEHKSSPVKPELVVDNGCQEQFIQTAYKTAKTTITCDRGNKDDSIVKLFCKENGSICEDISSTKYSPKSNVTINNRGVNVSISDVSSQHAGVYWCGVILTKGSYFSLRKIQLNVKGITFFKKSQTIGHNLTYWCDYRKSDPNKIFICKGEDPSICEPLANNALSNKNKKVFLEDKGQKQKLFITVTNVTPDDAGTYWCGAKSTDKKQSNQFFHRMEMTVVPPTSASKSHGLQVIITVVICASVLLLLFVLILILIYKRHSKNKRNAAAKAQHIKEEYIYEEIQELPQKPDSRNAMSTVYVTANFPTNPSALRHYSTIGFQNSSGEAGEALIIKPSEYSTVKDSQSPTYSNVNQPSSEEPFYSTVYNPQDEE